MDTHYCKVCGKVTTNKTFLCSTHGYLEGPVFVLDMETWKWKLEQRSLKNEK